MASNALKKLVQNQAYSVVLLQLSGVIILSLLSALIENSKTALAVLAGGLAYGIPNLVFVWRVFRFAGAHQMVQFVAAFFLGEMLKLFLSAFLVLVIVKYLPVSLLSVLVGFIGAIVSFWIACLWYFAFGSGSRCKVSKS